MTKSFSNWTATIAVVGALTGGAPVFAERGHIRRSQNFPWQEWQL